MSKLKLDPKSLYFIPLGGSEEFGMNLNVYASGDDILAVDCGIGFADERHPGIDILLPDPSFLEERKDKLKGLIVTHAHEDHVGAVAYLWERLECPLYATPFTAAVLRRKLQDAGLKKVPLEIIKPGETIKIGCFSVEFAPVAHSIPDAASLIIETPQGRVVHSGDWNLDPRPVTGKPTDPKPFKTAGEKGVLAYIGDSTNAGVPGRAGSESDVEKGLEAEFKKCKGRIAVTIFSSNIGRIISIARAAQKCGRDVGIIGRSLHRMIGAARDCGYLNDIPDFIDEADLGYLPNNKTVMIMTGSQGEYRAALPKIARNEHPSATLSRGDTVIFSARAIPGNDKNINAVKNNLRGMGIHVVTPDDTGSIIHVSGHPARDEISEMLQWVRPELVVPVHGERSQLEEQAALAKECQIPQVLVPSNGSIVKLAPGAPEIAGNVKTGLLAVDLKRIISADHKSITERRKLQYTGVVHISIAIDGNGKLRGRPKLDLFGLVDSEDEAERQIIENMEEEVYGLLEDLSWEELEDDHFVTEELRIGIRRFCFHVLGLKPKTSVHVMRV